MDGEIDRLLADGAGMMGSARFEGAAPGDRVTDGALVPGPNRVAPPCAHAQDCGGCQFQHVAPGFLASWKQARVAEALEAAGVPAPMRGLHISPDGSRRRATFTGRRTKKTVQLGYLARRSEVIVDVTACPLIRPELAATLPALRALTRVAASRKGVVKFLVTQTDGGPDLVVSGARAADEAVIALLAAGPWVRVAWNGDVLVQARRPVVRFDGIAVEAPPGAFLQATAEGEAALLASVREAIGGAGRVADLFCGCGTFALPLARQAEVRACDSGGEMVAALEAGWRGHGGLRPLTARVRDLFRRPLVAEEMRDLEAVVLDPPRAGAAAQVAELGGSGVPVLAYVSCNPVTFARDAAQLTGAGYHLEWVDVVDQFRWSAHVELVARFTRSCD